MIYEFKCDYCGKIFEILTHKYIKVNTNPDHLSCINCSANWEYVKRIYSHNNIRVQWSRGRGFYKPS
jgi:predicted nucleic acid-binding Zn ribbon protein